MDELTTIAKIVAVGGAPALFVWALSRGLPHILEAAKHFLEFRLRSAQQKEDQTAVRLKQLREHEALLALSNAELIAMLRAEIAAGRAEIAEGRSELQSVIELERECRDEAIKHREKLSIIVAQNLSMTEQNNALRAQSNQSAVLLRALEKTNPQWFASGLALIVAEAQK